MYLVCPYASDGGQILVIISRTFACVRSGDGLQCRVVEDVVPAFRKGSPCFVLNTLLFQESVGGLLLKERACFHFSWKTG